MFDFPGGQFVAFCAMFAVGTLGFFLFKFLRVPVPALLGSMVATGALSAAGFYPAFNTRPVSFLCNVMVGIMIGQQIDRTAIGRISRMIKPVLIQTGGMLVFSLVCGLSLYLVSSLDLMTSLISGATAGIVEMVIFGISLDADVSVVTFVHVFRIIFFSVMIPYLDPLVEKIINVPQTSRGRSDREKEAFVKFFGRKNYLTMIPLAFAGGALGFWLEIPTGTLLGTMLACGGMALLVGKHYIFDNRLSSAAQIGLGLVTGGRITSQIVEKLGPLFVPTFLMALVMLAATILMALLLSKTTEWDMTTCLLCVNPGGLIQVIAYAEDNGADSLTISVFHLVRVIAIVAFYPWLVLPLIS